MDTGMAALIAPGLMGLSALVLGMIAICGIVYVAKRSMTGTLRSLARGLRRLFR